MSTSTFLLLLLASVVLWFLGEASRRRRWNLERQMGLWSLLLSREWEVTETRKLLELRLGDDLKMASLSDRLAVDLEEIEEPLLKAYAQPGDIVRFGMRFFSTDNPRAASLFAICVNRKAEALQPA